jgi:hypothetical protein
MDTTGIAVFTYDRPNHLRQVLNGIEKNDIEHLYVFSDGPADSGDADRVRAVRSIITDINFCSTTVVARDENLGVAQSITSGVERVFEDHERVIVIEDDCVPASNYVRFMQTCLDAYGDVERVMSVSGYSPPIEIPNDYPYDVYFTKRPSSWGWGTWQSAWEVFEQDPITLDEFKQNKAEVRNTVEGTGNDVLQMMKDQLMGRIDSWAVWWGYAVAKHNGLCLNPVQSKIKNIGHDEKGTHSNETEKYRVELDEMPVAELELPSNPFVNKEIHDRYIEFIGGGQWYPLKRRLADTLKKWNIWRVYRTIRDYA